MRAGRGHLHYAAFDLLWLNGRDLRRLPLTRRKQRLERLTGTATPVLSRVFAVEARGRDMLGALQQLDLEGIVAKRKADPYGLKTSWYKIKNQACTQAEGRWSCSASVDLRELARLTALVPHRTSGLHPRHKAHPAITGGCKATGPCCPSRRRTATRVTP
jgi:ATP dependent DNA ligase-like protein